MAYVTRHAECRALLRDTEGFSSAQGFKAPGVVVPMEDRTLGELDPPNHSVVRRVMVTALTPKAVQGGRAATSRRRRRTLLAALPDAGEVDLVPAFTSPLPNASTVHLLGFPQEDGPQVMAWAKDLIESGFPGTHRNREGVEGFADGFPDFAGYIDARIEERRQEPRDDVTTKLVDLEVDGERLTPRQLRAMVRNLITGGLTTTSQLLGNLLYQLFTVPGPGGPAAVRPVGAGAGHRGEPSPGPAGDVRAPGLPPGHRGRRDGARGRPAGGHGHRLRQPGRGGVRARRRLRRRPGQRRRPPDLRLRAPLLPGRPAWPGPSPASR